MSRSDPPGGQNLDEILASIRKTLADEAPATPDPVKSPGGNGNAHGGAAGPPDDAAAPDTLPAKLAVALNGSANGSAGEADFGDLLAGSAQPDKLTVAPASAEQSDPLWFLTRPPEDPKATGQAKEQADAAELTRPEVVRAKFPPLFSPNPEPPAGAASAGAAATPAEKETASNGSGAQLRKEFTVKAKSAAENGAAPGSREEPRLPGEGGSAGQPKADQEPKPSEPGTVAPSGPSLTSPAPKSTAPSDPQAKALEQAIAQVLEPLLRRWLENNLPRMVQAAIREEVARTSKGERQAPELKI
jgi:cell pole-organizing protein PopZ